MLKNTCVGYILRFEGAWSIWSPWRWRQHISPKRQNSNHHTLQKPKWRLSFCQQRPWQPENENEHVFVLVALMVLTVVCPVALWGRRTSGKYTQVFGRYLHGSLRCWRGQPVTDRHDARFLSVEDISSWLKLCMFYYNVEPCRLVSSDMCCVGGWAVLDISKGPVAFIYTVNQSKAEKDGPSQRWNLPHHFPEVVNLQPDRRRNRSGRCEVSLAATTLCTVLRGSAGSLSGHILRIINKN